MAINVEELTRENALSRRVPTEDRLSKARPSQNDARIAYALDIVDLSKRFKRHTVRSAYTTLKSSLLFGLWRGLIGKPASPVQYTQAIKDLTLRIPQGSSVGIIGRNGSGKSTFLKLLTGIYKPDTGAVSVNGRVAALIELGAGFHPDFTGRENLYLGGVIHGLTRAQIDAKFEEIVRFAELEAVIDDPVRTYSSGMYMRLGFSLAIHTDPDILIVDEVLAVGDAAFVAKCKERIAHLRRAGKTLLLVTHDLEAIERWCDEVLWLHEGEVRDRGEPRRVIDHYRQFIEKGEELELLEENRQAVVSKKAPASIETDLGTSASGETVHTAPQPARWGSREIEITTLRLLDEGGQSRFLFHPEATVRIEIEYQVNEPVPDAVFGIAIHRTDGLLVHGSNTDIEHVAMPALMSKGKVIYNIARLGLFEGEFDLDVAVHRHDGYPLDYHKHMVRFAVRSSLRQIGVFVPQHEWQVKVSEA